MKNKILRLFSDSSSTSRTKSEDFSIKPMLDLTTKEQVKTIVQLFDTFQDEENLYFLMEYLPGGELANLFNKYRLHIKMEEIRLYLAEVILAIEELHKQNIVYRDLKLENIVIDKSGHVKLVDFGFAKMLGKERTYT